MSRGKKRTTAPRPARAALVPCTERGGATVEASLHSPCEPSLGSDKHPSSPCSSEKISQNHEHQEEEKKNRGGFLAEGDKGTSLSSSPLYSEKDSENERKENKSTSSSLTSPCESRNKKSPHETPVEGESAATAIPASAVSSAGCSRSNSETVYPSNISLKYSAPSSAPLSTLSGGNEAQENDNEEECECLSTSRSCPVYKKDEKGGKKNSCHSPVRPRHSDPSQKPRREDDDDDDECDASHDSACAHSSSSCLHAMEAGSLESRGNPPVTVVSSSVTSAPSLAFPSSSLSFPQFYSGSTSSRELLYIQHPRGCGGPPRGGGGQSGGVLRSAGHCGHHHSSHSQVEASVAIKKNGKFPSMPPLQSHAIQASLHPSFRQHGSNDDNSSTPFLHDQDEPWRTTSVEGCAGGGGGIEERKKGEAGGGHTNGGTHRARQKLVTASMVCCVFMFVEVVAGVLSNSLALMTDASHLLSDLCAFLIR